MVSVSKSEIDKIFGKILRDFRVKNGFTQEQLSEELGISLKYISRIENGNNGIKTQTFIKYMNILGIMPNIIYKDFINNTEVLDDINLFNKISSLSSDQKTFISSVIDLLKNPK